MWCLPCFRHKSACNLHCLHDARPGPAAEQSELVGRGRPGSRSVPAGRPGDPDPSGRGPAATGQPERSRPAAEALTALGPAGRGCPGGSDADVNSDDGCWHCCRRLRGTAGSCLIQSAGARFNGSSTFYSCACSSFQQEGASSARPGACQWHPPALKAAAHSFCESAGLLRGYALSFRVVFHEPEPEQRLSRTAATTVIQRALHLEPWLQAWYPLISYVEL
jgi:hypothetical protein